MKNADVVVLAAAVITVAVTARLGVWQLDRAAQKQAYVDAVQAKRDALPLTNADWQGRTPGAEEQHRPVRLTGSWEPQFTRYLDNRTMAGAVGFVVVTPLRLDDQTRVVVQRGWLPRNRMDRLAIAPYETSEQPVTIEGVLSLPPSQYFSLGDDPKEGAVLQNLDWARYASTVGGEIGTMSVKQEGRDVDGLQRRWDPIDAKISTHYGYAFQWFALSAATLFLYIWYQVWRPRRRRTKETQHG